MEKKLNRAAIYCRLSKEDEGESLSKSIINQQQLLKEYAINNNWKITKIYIDDDYSGASTDRPGFIELINDAENKCFDIILCKSLSRFSRDTMVIEYYIYNKFREWEIRFVSLTDNTDTQIKNSKKSAQINSLINEWYLEDLSENIKMVLESKMRRGEFIGTFAPYGYKKSIQNKNTLEIDENTAHVVKKIYDKFLLGFGTQKIANILNLEKIPNPRKQQELYGLRKTFLYKTDETGLWSAGTVADILKNMVYIGCIVQHKSSKFSFKSTKCIKNAKEDWIVVNNCHMPIISETDYETVNRIMQSRVRSKKNGHKSFLSGKVYCSNCGGKLTGLYSGKIEYFRCRNKYTVNRCDLPYIDVITIKNSIEKIINEYILEYEKINGKIRVNEELTCENINKINRYIKFMEQIRADTNNNPKASAILEFYYNEIDKLKKRTNKKIDYTSLIYYIVTKLLGKVICSAKNDEICANIIWKTT